MKSRRRRFVSRKAIALNLSGSLVIVAFSGCVDQTQQALIRATETEDESISREVYYDHWLKPPVSEEDKDFYYRSFLKNN